MDSRSIIFKLVRDVNLQSITPVIVSLLSVEVIENESFTHQSALIVGPGMVPLKLKACLEIPSGATVMLVTSNQY